MASAAPVGDSSSPSVDRSRESQTNQKGAADGRALFLLVLPLVNFYGTAMYIPAAFEEMRTDVLHQTMRDHSFATLVSTAGDGLPVVSHLPLIVDPTRGDRGTLIGHLARVNEHADLLSSGRAVLAIFQGPHAYISPAWYETSPSVPTWNYVAVHAWGVPRIVSDAGEVRDLLARTTATFESALSPYQLDNLAPVYVEHLAKAVVAFEIPIDRLEGKFKLSQNRSIADRTGVIAALQQRDETSRQVASLMEGLC